MSTSEWAAPQVKLPRSQGRDRTAGTPTMNAMASRLGATHSHAGSVRHAVRNQTRIEAKFQNLTDAHDKTV
ncbi:MAG: hypothetical protein QF570_05540 [Myxococcota bacterium]|nr:hypothetical protein [Myxococcota bacterium]